MLEAMRRNSRSVIIYVLFGVIIAAFIISFGPGSRGLGSSSSSGGGATYAAKVAGATITEADFHFAYMAITRGGQVPAELARDKRLKETLMDKLIERELFAQEAERLGFEVSEDEAAKMIVDGKLILLGFPRRMDDDPFFRYVFKDGKFDREHLKTVAQNQLGVTEKRFVDIERRELLADKVRELLKVSVKVSPDEVKADFTQRGLQVNLEFARFSPRRYEDDSEIPPAEIDAYIKAHDADLKKQFEDRAFLYKKTDKQARLRHIFVEVPKTAPPAAADAAKKQIDAAAAKIKAGSSFSEVAHTAAGDERSQKRGGLVGWRKKGFTGLGGPLDDKIFAPTTKKGDLIGPEKTERGWELVLVEDFREGDIPFEAAARELAEESVRNERGKARAKAEAQAILDKVKKGEKLEVLLPKESPTETQEEKLQKSFGRRLNDPPKLQETGMFFRRGELVQEIGVSKDLARRAFDLKPGELAGPFEVAGGWVIVRLKERKDPDLADYDKRQEELLRDYERTKWAEVLDAWSKQHCAEVRDDGRIRVNEEILVYEGLPPGKERSTKYEPCANTKLF